MTSALCHIINNIRKKLVIGIAPFYKHNVSVFKTRNRQKESDSVFWSNKMSFNNSEEKKNNINKKKKKCEVIVLSYYHFNANFQLTCLEIYF